MIDRVDEDIIKNYYNKTLDSMPTFPPEIQEQIKKEVERMTKEADEYFRDRRKDEDDDNHHDCKPKYYDEMSDKLDKEIDRLNKEYHQNL